MMIIDLEITMMMKVDTDSPDIFTMLSLMMKII